MRGVEEMLKQTKTDPPDYKKKYFAKKKAEGLKRIEIWIPVEREKELKELIKGMVDDKRRAAAQSS